MHRHRAAALAPLNLSLDILIRIGAAQWRRSTAKGRAKRKRGRPAKLERQRPDLLDRVLSGELSAHAAMTEAGFRKR